MADNRPIGVFDSGVGGLSVLSAIHRALPNESTLYLGDMARLPYGSKSGNTVIKYSLNAARALLALGEIKLLVVACSTASAHALEALESALPIPVVGTIGPTCRSVMLGRTSRSVAILATSGTVQSSAYEIGLRRLGFFGSIKQQPCPLFVPIVEEGMVEGEIATAIAKHYLNFLPKDVDTVVLGCTHYPALAPLLKSLLSPSTRWVDSGEETAKGVKEILSEYKLLNSGAVKPLRRYFVTDAVARLEHLSSLFLEERVERSQVNLIDL